MGSIDNFRRRMAAGGTDLRDERIKTFRRILSEDWKNDPSYVKEGAVIYGSDPARRIYPRVFEQREPLTGAPKFQFQTEFFEPFEVGDIIAFENGENWLCKYKPNKSGLYNQGTFVFCNHVLKFISPISGNFIECPVVMQNATQYNSGETPGAYLAYGTSQHIVLIPSAEDTVLLDHGFRFLIDVNHIHPTAYKITQVDPTTEFKGGKGVLRWIVSEDALRSDDDIANMVAVQDRVAPEWEDFIFEPETTKGEGWFEN